MTEKDLIRQLKGIVPSQVRVWQMNGPVDKIGEHTICAMSRAVSIDALLTDFIKEIEGDLAKYPDTKVYHLGIFKIILNDQGAFVRYSKYLT